MMEINGYEQHPVFATGFHANGFDVYTRLRLLGLHVMWHPELMLYHPWHPHSGEGDAQWALQKIVTDYRAVHLDPVAFNGIAPARDRQMPPDLVSLLRRARERHDSPSSAGQIGLRSRVKRTIRSILGRASRSRG